MVPHAQQRHDPQQLPLIAARPVQPDDQGIGVAGRVVQRREARANRVVLLVLNSPASISNVAGEAALCGRDNDCRGWLMMGDASGEVMWRRSKLYALAGGLSTAFH